MIRYWLLCQELRIEGVDKKREEREEHACIWPHTKREIMIIIIIRNSKLHLTFNNEWILIN